MLARTNPPFARWQLVEADSKRWARVKVVETVVSEIEKGCEARGFELPPLPVLTLREERQVRLALAAQDVRGPPRRRRFRATRPATRAWGLIVCAARMPRQRPKPGSVQIRSR